MLRLGGAHLTKVGDAIVQMLVGCLWVFVGAHLAKGLGGACLTKVGEVIIWPRHGCSWVLIRPMGLGVLI